MVALRAARENLLHSFRRKQGIDWTKGVLFVPDGRHRLDLCRAARRTQSGYHRDKNQNHQHHQECGRVGGSNSVCPPTVRRGIPTS